MARLSDDEIKKHLQQTPGWVREGEAIRRRYALGSFAQAIAFVNRVAALAEEANHHPDILIQFDRVTLTLTSHDLGSLTERDFRLAARIGA